MKKTFKISKSNQKLIESASKLYFGGHYTIFSFSTCYCFMFGTPSGREDIESLDRFDNIDDAITNAIQKLIRISKELNSKNNG
jgi:hypothetical protein